MPTSLTIVGATDLGRVRLRNEDTLVLLPDLGAAVVADGMGGVPGGDVASRAAATAVERTLRDRLSRPPPGDEDGLSAVLESAIAAAHVAVREAGQDEPDLGDMGTTLTVLAVRPREGVWALGHVGDSRAYLLRDGVLVQLTRDQTWVQDLVDEGRISAGQALLHPYRHVLSQCVGSPEAPEPQITAGSLRPGDLYLLCTDGLTGMLDDEDLLALLGSHIAPGADVDAVGTAAALLVAAANERGGEDNVTVALVRIDEDDPATRAAQGG